MNQIKPFLLWLGHAGDGRDNKTVIKLGIRAVVQLAVEEPLLQMPRELIYCRFPLVDGLGNDPELLASSISTLTTLLWSKIPTLICCGVGMSRTPALAAVALALILARSPAECLDQIARQHPTDVSPAFWKEVCAMLPADSVSSSLTEAQKMELDRRIAELNPNPNKILTWEEIKSRLLRP